MTRPPADFPPLFAARAVHIHSRAQRQSRQCLGRIAGCRHPRRIELGGTPWGQRLRMVPFRTPQIASPLRPSPRTLPPCLRLNRWGWRQLGSRRLAALPGAQKCSFAGCSSSKTSFLHLSLTRFDWFFQGFRHLAGKHPPNDGLAPGFVPTNRVGKAFFTAKTQSAQRFQERLRGEVLLFFASFVFSAPLR